MSALEVARRSLDAAVVAVEHAAIDAAAACPDRAARETVAEAIRYAVAGLHGAETALRRVGAPRATR